MKTRPLAVALLVALAPATFPTAAVAQSGAEDPVTSMARARFKEGVDFYDKGQFEQARAAFLQAYALKKHPAVLLNLAWSCLKSGHALDAERYFKQFLSEGKDITDKQRADANDGANQARSKIGRIDVVAPQGTEITIDGDRVGAAPLADPVPVEPGAHTVTFKGTDTATETQSVSVLGGEKAVVRFARKAAAEGTSGGGGGGTERTLPSPTPAPTSPPAETPSESPAPSSEEPKPSARARHAETPEPSGPGLFSPPDNLVPVVVGGVLVAASVGVAVAMVIGKNAANDSASTTFQRVRSANLACDPPSDATNANLVSACNSYDNDLNNVNTDATIGNIAIGVGIAAFAGAVIYWFVGDKSGATTHTGKRQPIVPLVTAQPGGGSMLLGGKF